MRELAKRRSSLLRRCALIVHFGAFLLRAADFLDQASGRAARSDGRTAADAGVSGIHDLVRLVRPRLTLLARAAFAHRLRKPITLVLRRMAADDNGGLGRTRARIVPV